jgi:hypothetical protein
MKMQYSFEYPPLYSEAYNNNVEVIGKEASNNVVNFTLICLQD